MKRFICTLIILISILGVAPRIVFADGPHKSGSLVVSDKTIFLIGSGQKRGFQSWNEFLSYNYRVSRIVAANDADKLLPEGPPMRAKAGTLVLDMADNQTIYLIGKSGEKRGFVSGDAFKKYKKKKTIIWPINLSSYPVGQNIE